MDNDGKLFESVYRPGSGEFFDRNGLLYLKLEELEQLSDKLTTAQPLLGPLSADFTIGTFVETLERAIREGSEKDIASLSPVLDQIALAIDAVNTNQSYHVDWSKLLVDESTSDQLHREFLVVNPNLEFSRIQPAGAAIRQIRALSKEIDAVNQNAVRIRLTGAVSMEHEEMISASRGAGLAGLLALVAVTVGLMAGIWLTGKPCGGNNHSSLRTDCDSRFCHRGCWQSQPDIRGFRCSVYRSGDRFRNSFDATCARAGAEGHPNHRSAAGSCQRRGIFTSYCGNHDRGGVLLVYSD